MVLSMGLGMGQPRMVEAAVTQCKFFSISIFSTPPHMPSTPATGSRLLAGLDLLARRLLRSLPMPKHPHVGFPTPKLINC